MENEEFPEGPWFASELAVCTTCAIEILEKESISASNSSNHVLNHIKYTQQYSQDHISFNISKRTNQYVGNISFTA
jgi:hypothetical protein